MNSLIWQSVMWRPGKLQFLIGVKNPLPIGRPRSPENPALAGPRPSPDSRLRSGYALPSSRIRRHSLILIDALFSSCLPRSTPLRSEVRSLIRSYRRWPGFRLTNLSLRGLIFRNARGAFFITDVLIMSISNCNKRNCQLRNVPISPATRRPKLIRGWRCHARHTQHPEEIDADQNAGENSQRRQCERSALAAVVSWSPGARGQVVSKMWEYIRSHNLQNPENRREILADDKLRKVFGKDKVTMFEMNKHLAAI
jgi:hypothetical protein